MSPALCTYKAHRRSDALDGQMDHPCLAHNWQASYEDALASADRDLFFGHGSADLAGVAGEEEAP